MNARTMLLVAALGASAVAAAEGPPAARKIPGINAEDPFPNGCVDCHLNYADKKLDTRFGTLLRQWGEKVEPSLLEKARAAAPSGLTLAGRHPEASGSVASVPGKCLACHGRTSKMAPPFAGMIHAIHLTGGEQNPYLTVFQGECTHCHKLDLASGRWRLPSAPER
ncbi:MAG TPA: hypothetical protein VF139_18755 [Candidatus Polarisedimenticolaceae bacterium]